MEIGQIYDIHKLLATPQRDYLVRNNGDKVNVKDIEGKTIVIYFVPLRKGYRGRFGDTEDLIFCYRHRMPYADFEVVLVARIGDEVVDECEDSELFDNCFSKMPWLAIPQHDIESRKCLQKYDDRSVVYFPRCTILDPNGLVIASCSADRFGTYGVLGYPFTDARMKQIEQEDGSVWKTGSLANYLTTPSRDFLINNQGEKVHVNELEGKVVGLYFYKGSCRGDAHQVAKIYQTLKDRGESFEIVQINCYQREKHEQEFEDIFQSMPWLAWPLSDKNYLRLSRFFGWPYGKLIIISGPNMEMVDEYALDVLEEYGIDAYPFTRRGAAVSEVKKLKELSVQTVLASLGQDFLVGKDGSKVQLSEVVQGKSICLLVATPSCKVFNGILDILIDWYDQVKMKDDAFEVVYVSWKDEEDTESYLKMPWLVSPLRKDIQRDSYFRKVFNMDPYEIPSLIAFGSDGRILTMEGRHKLMKKGVDAYPFNDDELVDEILDRINGDHMWPTDNIEQVRARING